ncbi:RNA 2'-phosphotransferase [Janthinobacterium sp. UMAB-56]|uniref:RNA 2'-phosphotransferase n=1 Tax=Janthinobacterium sp. UMAB-56 TaxID=1365361 RepID=UPI0035ABCE5B
MCILTTLHSGRTEQLVNASKFLARILRHYPGGTGFVLDAQGCADIGQLLALAARYGRRLSREQLDDVVPLTNRPVRRGHGKAPSGIDGSYSWAVHIA